MNSIELSSGPDKQPYKFYKVHKIEKAGYEW